MFSPQNRVLSVSNGGAAVNQQTRIQSPVGSGNGSPADPDGIGRAVHQIGDGWSLLIIWQALNGVSRFDKFQSRLGVARNILSNRLARLVQAGLLVKRPVRPGARRLEYRATARAYALRPALEMLENWGQSMGRADFSNAAATGETRINGTHLPSRGHAEIHR